MERVRIGCNYPRQSTWKIFLGVPLIYLPLFLTLPFVALGIFFVKLHLRHVGGMELKSYWEFVPEWISHRYRSENQIILDDNTRFFIARTKWFWLFNCKLYCPLSVAAFRYMAYLVMIVENWWCPFEHSKKSEYAEGAIDRSFWHVFPEEVVKLHPDDRDNPIWNEDAKAAYSKSK